MHDKVAMRNNGFAESNNSVRRMSQCDQNARADTNRDKSSRVDRERFYDVHKRKMETKEGRRRGTRRRKEKKRMRRRRAGARG